MVPKADVSALPDGPPVTYSWRAHPVRHHPGRAVAGGLVIIVFGALVWLLCHQTGAGPIESLVWGVGSAFALSLAGSRFYLPSRFEIDEEGITARYPLRMKRLRWAETRRFVYGPATALLSRRGRQTRLEHLSGIMLAYDPAQRDEIVSTLRAHLPAACGGAA